VGKCSGPQETVCECCHGEEQENEGHKGKLIRLATGIVIFSAGLAVLYLADVHAFIPVGLLLASYIILGGDVVLRAFRNILSGRIFDENLLMSAATIGAFAIGEFSEAVTVMLFYQIGEFFQEAAVRKSRKSISELMDIRPDYANIITDGNITAVSPGSVEVGRHIIVRPGEKIPLDGVIIDGGGLIDTGSLTGESLPRFVTAGDTVLSGCVSQNGLLTIEVTKPFGESTVAKIIDLVEKASGRKAPTESFITRFSRYYTPAVVLLAVLLAIAPPLILGLEWAEWIHRGLVFLVISCPCALVISIPLGFFGGIGKASRNGILVKGGNFLEALNDLDIVVFDKTGTLTKGLFSVTGVHAAPAYTEKQVLEIAAFAESFSNHPIALSISEAYGGNVDKGMLSDFKEMAGFGTSVLLDGKRILAGNGKLLATEGVPFPDFEDTGTMVHIAVQGEYAGSIVISDEVRPDSREAILGLKARGVGKTVMLTGDNTPVAERIASELSLDEVYAQLLPHEKVERLEELEKAKRPGGKLAFIGDGINDAPVLARADIGIAMGGLGSDAAIEAADVVLMTDEPYKLVTAVDIAAATRRVVWQNIIFALGVKGLVLLLGAFGLASMWGAVFADVGVSLLAVLNATRLLRR